MAKITTKEALQGLKAVERRMAGLLTKEVGTELGVAIRGEDRWTVHGKPAAVKKAVVFLEKHGLMRLESQAHDEELGETFAYLESSRRKANPEGSMTSGRGAGARKTKPARGTASKAAPRPDTNKVQPLRSKGADRHRTEKQVEALLEGIAKKAAPQRKKPAEPKAKVESATVKLTFNPTTPGDVERVWKLWTGARPGQVLKVKVTDPTGQLPEHVALLGRVAKLIQADGKLLDFGDGGPLLVTDGTATRVWLLHTKVHRFDVRPRVICYLARKPKFGDRGLVEYIHAFEGPARARMDGQVGELTGSFRLTPRGIEG